MSGFLLDTNVTSELIRLRPDPAVSEWVFNQERETLFLSVITIGELRKGFAILPQGKRRADLEQWLDQSLLPSFAGRVLPVTQSIAESWGILSGGRHLGGRPLAMADGLIAATALDHGLMVVTRNVRDFLDLGVTLLNPWDIEPLPQ